ncbi:MAG: photosynthetic complex putative assembly protein PuhB [Hydrogenophaga sp.]|nr:photosynthetic complex putative assembly protein PuhB [Hydrogenophaga sp.]
MNAHHEHEFEAAPGLPEPLPKGERMIWQGSPDFRMLAIHAFHVRKLALYFTAMLALQWIYLSADPAAPLVRPLLTSAGMALLALGLLTTIAWFSARTTLYTLTDRRIVMRIGIVLTLTFNLPLRQVSGAAIKPQGAGHGDIALALSGSDRIAWLNLWPHARPWQLRQPQPSLRCVSDAQAVGARIQQAWNVVHPEATPVRGEVVQLPVRPPRENRVPAVTA